MDLATFGGYAKHVFNTIKTKLSSANPHDARHHQRQTASHLWIAGASRGCDMYCAGKSVPAAAKDVIYT
jgi:hypothetical protein